MQFYNELSNSNGAHNSAKNNEVNKLKSKFRSQKSQSRSHKKAAKAGAKNSLLSKLNLKTNENDDSLAFLEVSAPAAFLYTGWQQTSSKLFSNEALFPSLNVPNQFGKIVSQGIQYDKQYFRINSKKNPAPQTNKDFYYRMNHDRLSYTVDATDMNVLQILHFKDYDKVEELPIKFLKDRTKLSCFEMIEATSKFRFNICNKDRKESLKLMCIIATRLSVVLDSCTKDDKDEIGTATQTVVKQTILDATIVIAEPSKNCNDKWTYDNHGDDWECLCKEGTEQSPIDLPALTDTIYSPVSPLFQFEEVPAKSPITTVEGFVQEDGNIKVNYLNGAIRVLHPNLGKIVTLNGNVYIAEEISVHTPSEHTKEGKRFDMEIQVSFYGVSKGDIAKQVVLSFLFEKRAGYYNKFIDDLDFYTLPNVKEPVKFILNDLFIPKLFYSVTGENDADELPVLKPFDFYTYDGSMTMPPCSEEVIHYVVAEPIPIGSVVLDLANEALKVPDMKKEDSSAGQTQTTTIIDDSTTENYRNLQEKNHRQVFYFDHNKYSPAAPMLDNPEESRPKDAHYEKTKKDVYFHIFVPGTAPSGIPGSFLESKDQAYGIEKKK